MKLRRRRWLRAVMLGIVAFPLLATGPCLSIAQESAIAGFFQALTPILVDQLKDHLGVRDTGTGGAS